MKKYFYLSFLFYLIQCKHTQETPKCGFETLALHDLSTPHQRTLDPKKIYYSKILLYAPREIGFLKLNQNKNVDFDSARKRPPEALWTIEPTNQAQFKIQSDQGYLIWEKNHFEWSKDERYPKEKFEAVYFNNPKEEPMVKIKSSRGFYLSYKEEDGTTVLSSDGEDLYLVWIVNMWDAITAFSKDQNGKKIPFEEQNRFKKYTLGYLEKGSPSQDAWGFKFHTEFWYHDQFWLYEGFPKKLGEYENGKNFQIVWNGLKEVGDLIFADSTIPRAHPMTLWSPGVPRAYSERQAIGYKIPTREVTFITKDINPTTLEPLPGEGTGKECGMVYAPYEIDLTQGRTKEGKGEESIGSRWVIDIGLSSQSERWAFDLGPEVGVFKPRFGLIGYHSHAGFQDTRYLGRIQTINRSKPEDKEKFFHTPGGEIWAPTLEKKP